MMDIEQMIKELLAAGWLPMKATVWRSPAGELFRGPYGAWKVLDRRVRKIVEIKKAG